ncbi:hypothetical protein KDW_07360 [Dictyobacter vulcani]|uniref:Uncharacterized protein n=1 Tax=Dictyobacter vulcani TaxID=2607529 RepID=A0A5J4KCI3_9CHLR|nr:hypothetical protein KDW_07360 [Dictyobacter vulcani]
MDERIVSLIEMDQGLQRIIKGCSMFDLIMRCKDCFVGTLRGNNQTNEMSMLLFVKQGAKNKKMFSLTKDIARGW